MTKNQRVSRITAGDVKRDDYFRAIDQGLALWLANEKEEGPRTDRYKALCAGSCEALEVAIEVLRYFARNRKLVSVRITSEMLADVPHGRLTPAQVFYRWDARIGPETADPLHGVPVIGNQTFGVRPVMTWGRAGERFVHARVALQRRKGGILETVPYDVDEVVDITSPITPNHPTQLSVAAKHVLRVAEREQPRLAKILTTLFEQFEVELRNMLLWSRRRRLASRSTLTLLLARETGVEAVLVMRVPGGGVALVTRPPDDPDTDVEEMTHAQVGRAILEDILLSAEEEGAVAEQNIFDLLDSWPNEDDAVILHQECVRLRTEADSAIDVAAAELVGAGAIDEGWLPQAREEAEALTQETLFGPGSHDISLSLAKRHVHGTRDTQAIAGRLAMRNVGYEIQSEAHRRVVEAAQRVVDALPRFYTMPILHADLQERLGLLQQIFELYRDPTAPVI
jgi:hypothetical protein